MLLARQYGTGDIAGFRETASTALISGILFAVFLSGICIAESGAVLRLIRTPAGLLPDASAYLRIIFCGLVFTFLYNYYSAALLAIGDSRTPFLILLFSSVLNVTLDLLAVACLGWGVPGAALATVAAQAVSFYFCCRYVRRRIAVLSFERSELGSTKIACAKS